MKKPTSKRTGSRTDGPSPFDFNTHPKAVHLHAAATVTTAQLEKLFAALDNADEDFSDDARLGTLEALDAISEFLTASSLDGTGRFSRPLRLLRDELENRPRNEDLARILPPDGGGAGGANSGRSGTGIKAAAACALEWLHVDTGLPIGKATALVAARLTNRGFKYGGRRGDGAEAIKTWRRDYLQNAELPSPIAILCRAFKERRPIELSDNAAANRQVIVGWLDTVLARAGYGETA